MSGFIVERSPEKAVQPERASGGRPLRKPERVPRGPRELGTLCGAVVIMRLKLHTLARFGEYSAERVRHYAAGHGGSDVARHW
jgi:hypothetical protein